MKMTKLGALAAMAMWVATGAAHAAESEATSRIRRSERHTRGDSMQATVSMKVERPGTERSLRFKTWNQGTDRAVIKILEPLKDRDTGNLRLALNLWQYLPNIDRLVKVPPSMMLQSWMGSDFTNDDLVRSSSLATDYTHEIAGKEDVRGDEAVRIVCTPKPDAPVVWGKIIEWVRAKDNAPLRRELYSERGELLKRMEGSDVRTFGSHVIPTRLVMTDLKKPGNSTSLVYESVTYDEKIAPSVFQQEYLRKRVR